MNNLQDNISIPRPVEPLDVYSVEQFKERLKNREIWINGPITERIIDTLYINLIQLNSGNSQLPITVMINSLGGGYFEAFVVTDIMSSIQAPVTTVGLSHICSGGFILFMGGRHRVAHENTDIMIHSAGLTMADKIPMLDERLEYMKKSLEQLARFFEQQTNMPYKFWKDIIDSGKERYFTAEEARKLGIIHQIIGKPKIMPKLPYTWDLTPSR